MYGKAVFSYQDDTMGLFLRMTCCKNCVFMYSDTSTIKKRDAVGESHVESNHAGFFNIRCWSTTENQGSLSVIQWLLCIFISQIRLLICIVHSGVTYSNTSRTRKSQSAVVFRLGRFSSWRMLTLSRLTLMHVWLDRDDVLSADIAFDVFKVTWTRRRDSAATRPILFR